MVRAVESESGGTGFDSRRAQVTFLVDFWSCWGYFFMYLGSCGEWLGDVLGGGWGGLRGGRKMSKTFFPKNAWEYVPRIGGIKIRGLGILPDQKVQKTKNMIFGILGVGGMGGALYYNGVYIGVRGARTGY